MSATAIEKLRRVESFKAFHAVELPQLGVMKVRVNEERLFGFLGEINRHLNVTFVGTAPLGSIEFGVAAESFEEYLGREIHLWRSDFLSLLGRTEKVTKVFLRDFPFVKKGSLAFIGVFERAGRLVEEAPSGYSLQREHGGLLKLRSTTDKPEFAAVPYSSRERYLQDFIVGKTYPPKVLQEFRRQCFFEDDLLFKNDDFASVALSENFEYFLLEEEFIHTGSEEFLGLVIGEAMDRCSDNSEKMALLVRQITQRLRRADGSTRVIFRDLSESTKNNIREKLIAIDPIVACEIGEALGLHDSSNEALCVLMRKAPFEFFYYMPYADSEPLDDDVVDVEYEKTRYFLNVAFSDDGVDVLLRPEVKAAALDGSSELCGLLETLSIDKEEELAGIFQTAGFPI